MLVPPSVVSFVDVTLTMVNKLGNPHEEDPKRGNKRYLPEGISVGNRISKSRVTTLYLIRHRDIVLNNVIDGTTTGKPIPEARDANEIGISQYQDQSLFVEATSETNDLQNKMNAIIADKGSGANWETIYYPAASFCYAYEPTVQPGETLAPCFKRHNWSLPSTGLLARYWWYNNQGSNSIFANAIAKGVYTSWAVNSATSNGMHSCQEQYYNNDTGRAADCCYRVNNTSNGADVTNCSKYDACLIRAVAEF